MTTTVVRLGVIEQRLDQLEKRMEKVENKMEILHADLLRNNKNLIQSVITSAGMILAGCLSIVVTLLLG